jgi:hypothetical protein
VLRSAPYIWQGSTIDSAQESLKIMTFSAHAGLDEWTYNDNN